MNELQNGQQINQDIASSRRERFGKAGRIAKDWITTTLAVCAFILSVPNAYYNFIARNDDLRVIVTLFPELDMDFANSRGKFYGDRASFVFINSGNRPTAVTGIRLVAAKRDYYGAQGECFGPTVESDGEAFVVKEGETLTKLVRLVPATQYVMTSDIVVLGDDHKPSFSIERDPQKDYFVAVCLVFDVAFSANLRVSKETDMTMRGYSPDGSAYDTGGDYASSTIVIRRKVGTIFNEDD